MLCVVICLEKYPIYPLATTDQIDYTFTYKL